MVKGWKQDDRNVFVVTTNDANFTRKVWGGQGSLPWNKKFRLGLSVIFMDISVNHVKYARNKAIIYLKTRPVSPEKWKPENGIPCAATTKKKYHGVATKYILDSDVVNNANVCLTTQYFDL